MYTTESGIVRFRVALDEAIPGIVIVGGQYVDGQVMHVDFVPQYFIAMALEHVDGLSYKYEKQNERAVIDPVNNTRFGAAELNLFLRDAEIQISRARFDAGDEYVDIDGIVHTHEYAGYNTEILGIVVTDRIQKKLDAMIDKVFGI